MYLDIKRLNLEYIQWELKNKDGRNADDLRFGQYMHNKYIVEGVDVFYIESAENVYYKLLNTLVENEERAQQNG